MTKSLTELDTLTFDCHGTLIDWESGIWDALQPVLVKNRCDAIDRKKALETFARQESLCEAQQPDLIYSEILKQVHLSICREHGLVTTPELNEQFGQSVDRWPAFPDTADAFRILKHHYKLVILSNVHREGFAASNRQLGVIFDAVYTAEDVGSYKPNGRNFEYMIERLGQDLNVTADIVLYTAQSLFHDHVPATKLGLSTAWIDRQGLANSDNWGATARVDNRPDLDYVFSTMMAMAHARESAETNSQSPGTLQI